MNASTERKIWSLQRELDMRQGVYPKLVAQGRMTQHFAEEEIEVLKDILSDYRNKHRQNQDAMDV